MKIKKALFYLIIVLLVVMIYSFTKTNKINYVVIGDSISGSRNEYNELQYGYSNYIEDYLKSNNRLESYYNYSKNTYNVQNLIDDIENNKSDNIKRLLRESDLVTMTIGMLDISQMIVKYNSSLDYDSFYLESNYFLRRLVDVVLLVKKYAKNNVIAIGFYNPFPNSSLKSDIDKMITDINERYKRICKENNVVFIDIFCIFENSNAYSNSKDNINISNVSQRKIFEIIKIKLNKMFNM